MSMTHKLGIAGINAIKSPDQIRTVLGSCIGITVCDVQAGIGGMAHVMLPQATGPTESPGKFADTGVDALVESVLASGAVQSRLKAKIAGGAAMFGEGADSGIGSRNAQAVRERLQKHGIAIVASEVGGNKGRRMSLNPETGEVEVQIIGQEATVL
ncbi:MAG: chemoreceptor glutamine deamidase CheD [Phycisphaerae bacterium]|nr:MAG: chemoreceptor glutamine deamidase CheD [Phycisphaerae bacterium]